MKTSKGFLYGIERKMTNGERVSAFDRERAFIEYVREFKAFPWEFDAGGLDAPKLRRYLARYPIRTVSEKILKTVSNGNP